MKSLTQQTPINIQELAQSINIQVSGLSQYRKFQRLYRNDRVAFVFDIMPDYARTITPYQLEILGYYDEGKERVAVRGPHGLGKTFVAATLTHHSVLTCEDDGKVPTTASAWRQLEKYLWPEIKKLAKAIDWQSVGREPYNLKDELMNLSIRLNDGLVEAFAVASDDHNTIEGAHGTLMFYIFDEAKTIPRETWNAAEGAFSTAGTTVLEEDGSVKLVSTKPGLVVWDDDASDYLDKDPEELLDVRSGMEDGYISEDNKGHLGGQESQSFIGELEVSSGGLVGSSNSAAVSSNKGYTGGQLYPTPRAMHTPATNFNPLSPGLPSIQAQYGKHQVPRSIQPNVAISRAYALAISTPGEPSGQFYDIHMQKPGFEDWTTRHVTLDEAIRAGRISGAWANQRARQWGIDSSLYQNRVLGEFADTSEEGVIPLSWVRAAMDRWRVWYTDGKPDLEIMNGRKTIGCDVARGGVDKTVLATRDALVIRNLYTFSKLSTTSTAGRIQSLCKGRHVHIEMDGGLGAAVYDMLHDESVPMLHPITVSSPTLQSDRSGELRFENVRAGMWWHMRELLDPEYGSEVLLPPVPELELDLSTPTYEMKKGAVIQIESKLRIASKIGRSTDYGDAVCLAFWDQSSGGGVVF